MKHPESGKAGSAPTLPRGQWSWLALDEALWDLCDHEWMGEMVSLGEKSMRVEGG